MNTYPFTEQKLAHLNLGLCLVVIVVRARLTNLTLSQFSIG